MVTMEKSEQNKAASRLSVAESYDTRPVNGTPASQRELNRVAPMDVPGDEAPVSLKQWIEAIIYWVKELRWRVRYWSGLRGGDE